MFWGGGCDTQKLLPFGTVGEVYEYVLEQCRIFAKNGGLIFNSVHNVQAKTNIDNLVGVFQAVKTFNR